jgi:nucleotide-binding universal stress UspA family protein
MYKGLLVLVDGRELSDRAMHESVELAQQLGAAITGFVAEPLQPAGSDARPHSLCAQDVKEHDARTAAHARRILSRLEAVALVAGVPFEGFHDQVPRIDSAIIQAAERRAAP